jgi:hypothetical protein
MLNGMVRRLLLLGAVALVVTGCGQTLDERAGDLLQRRVDAVHEGFLDVRARDPQPTGQAMLEQLDPYGEALEAEVEGDDVLLVQDIGASVSETEGWFMPETTTASLGACVEVTVRAGDGRDDRGSVRTEPVPCPDGTEIRADDGYPAQRLTTDLEGHEDDVGPKPYDRPVCYSGGDCSEGGG